MASNRRTVRRSNPAPASRATKPGVAIAERVRAVLLELEGLADPRVRAQMADRFAIHTPHAHGIPMDALRAIAKRLGREHALAQALWQTGCYEARVIATHVAEPQAVTVAMMDAWAADFDNWAICDTACLHLLDRTPHAFARIAAWAQRDEEFVRRAAFALLAAVAVHDRALPDAVFARELQRCERAASNERNFVVKAIVWALRSIGRRSEGLHAAALATAERLAARSDRTARWIGHTAARELRRTKPRAAKTKATKAGRRAAQ